MDNQTASQAATHRELERRSHDQIMVHNPLSEPYQFRWGGFVTLIPSCTQDKGFGKGNALLERGQATKYVKEIVDLILVTRLDGAVKAENERRISGGMREMDKHQEEVVFSTPFRPDNPDNRAKIIEEVWLGVYHEYGMDAMPSHDEHIISSNKPVDEQLLAKLDKPYAPKEPTLDIEKADFNNTEALDDKGVFELRSIAKTMGIDVERTAKKQDIINRINQT